MKKDITYYTNKFKGIIIERTGKKNLPGFYYYLNGPMGAKFYAEELSFFDEEESRIYQELKDYQRTIDLESEYPYLYISKHGIWIRSLDRKRDGVVTDFKWLGTYSIYNIPEEVSKLNEEAKAYHKDPENFFFCSLCSKTYLREDKKFNNISLNELINLKLNRYGDSYLSGCYCDICLDKNEDLKTEIALNKSLGYYA